VAPTGQTELASPIFSVAGSGNSYVLLAGKWGAKQTRAVEQAGGTVTFSGDGIGIASSDDADFLGRALASGAFSDGARDTIVQWQPPVQAVQLEQSTITPGDEFFYPLQWNMGAIEAPAAWGAGCTGNGVRIAVLDGGLPSAHEDIAPNLDVAASASFVPGFNYDDDTGLFRHAGHVAGIAAAPDNGEGVIGVAPEATIIGVKVLHDGEGPFGQIIQGIEYASRSLSAGGAGADIINMSLSGIFPKADTAGGNGPLVAAVNKVVNTASRRGVLVISSAGNNGFNFDQSGPFTISPAESGNGIAISATGPFGWAQGATDFTRFASYSNSGNSLVHVAGPGGDFALPGNDVCTVGPVTQLCWVLDMVMSVYGETGGNHYYGWAAGTSQSAPAAAGVAALIKQRYPNISVGAWKNKLANTADDLGKPGNDTQYGRGFINARRACTE
jgi:subtilisin family serine protease